jgi:hypothetical protein
MKRYVALLAAQALVVAAVLVPTLALAKVVDGIPDSWELRYHLSLNINQAKLDQDRDLLNNLSEYRAHTSPRDADTDNDGIRDADEDYDGDGLTNRLEQLTGNNPGKSDTNGNGIRDGDEGEEEDEDDDEEDDDDEDDEDDEPDDRVDGGDRLQPKRADEQLCPNCFLLVRANAPGCPVGDDACPIFG